MKKTIATLTSALLLAACGGEDSGTIDTDNWNAGTQSLVYSYPARGQTEIATPAPVILRFTSAVDTSTAQDHITLHQGNRNGPTVSYTLREIDNGRGLVLTPDSQLTPLTRYTVVVDGLPLVDGDTDSHVFAFTTRALEEGPRSQVLASEDFALSRLVPDGQALPVMDFSSFRLQFTQPLDPASVQYGDSLALTGPGGELVEARVLVDGPYLTLDPADDLTAGQNYTLSLADGLSSTAGNSFAADSYTLTPGDSHPREVMVQQVSDSANRAVLSPLTGLPINEVPVNATLLGEDNATQQGGDVHAELAFVPNYPDVTPFTVPRSTILAGTSIDVNIGGEVPAGFSTGAVNVHFLSDASGYLLPNPYSQRADAPRQVRLFMDVAMSTEDPTANGAVTQDILHIELVGTALVKDGIMTIDAVSVVEPNILGQERGYGTLSFHMEAYPDQQNPPQQVADTTPPELQSWAPGEDASAHLSSDPIVLNFSEPLNPATVTKSRIALQENGTDIPYSLEQDGAAIILRPDNGLQHPTQSDFSTRIDYVYDIILGEGLTDLAGNAFMADTPLTFALPEQPRFHEASHINATGQYDPPVTVNNQRAPVVLSAYPGFPCVLDDTQQNLANDIAGQCLDSLREAYTGFSNIAAFPSEQRAPSDLLPVAPLPADRPIIVQTSKPLLPESVQLGTTFEVHEVDNNNTVLNTLDGDLKVEGNRITFWPSNPWQENRLYRYTLHSTNDFNGGGSVLCDGSQAICDTDDLPLQTQLQEVRKEDLANTTVLSQTVAQPDTGGQNLQQYFRGAASSDNVIMALKAPSADTNANFIHDRPDPFPDEYPATRIMEMRNYTMEEAGPGNQPLDPHACSDPEAPCYDPDGLTPPPNSAKLLSTLPNTSEGIALTGINTGCGYTMTKAPMPCPTEKFVYLNSAVVAEMGQYDEDEEAVAVKLWPAQVFASSLAVRAQVQGQIVLGVNTGPQVMRMRYAKADPDCIETPQSPCLRNQPISAWIRDVNGTPTLEANIELFVDAPALQENLDLKPFIPVDWNHEVYNLPINLELSGEIHFNPDGTMHISQFNTNDVSLVSNLMYEWLESAEMQGRMEMLLPGYGSHLQYRSDVIKR
ncbi:MAG: Ig-like domain-containing protein [Pseudomonadales bacterium]|nr:Ig-like domain-containing protein [Pseudomonadales bacterium]